MPRSSARAGVYTRQPAGYQAFEPAPLPPSPPIDLHRLEPFLSRANVALGRLDGMADVLPNPDLFVAMYVRNEAVLSSQIEGTQASLDDVLEYEAGIPSGEDGRPPDVVDVYTYGRALNFGLARLNELPLSLRLLREIHAKLLEDTRGGEKTPGEFRRTQNWIGAGRCTIEDAVFVPPPHLKLQTFLDDLECYLRADDPTPVLLRCGVAHCQFETIHPFLDGNGRLGRLLITLLLCERGVLRRPLLYLSLHFKRNQSEYYEWLMRVREEGDWEGWLRFFLEGVEIVSDDAVITARRVLALQSEHRALVSQNLPNKPTPLRALDLLAIHPVTTAPTLQEALKITTPTAYTIINDLERLGLLVESTGKQRNRVFRYSPYLDALTPR